MPENSEHGHFKHNYKCGLLMIVPFESIQRFIVSIKKLMLFCYMGNVGKVQEKGDNAT